MQRLHNVQRHYYDFSLGLFAIHPANAIVSGKRKEKLKEQNNKFLLELRRVPKLGGVAIARRSPDFLLGAATPLALERLLC